MKIKHLILILQILIPITIFSQSSYISSDSTAIIEVKILAGNAKSNAKTIKMKTDGKIIEYNPHQIKEYRLTNGRVYISKEIKVSGTTEKVFLERLVHGKSTIYYFRGKKLKTYFLEKDSSSLFIELPKRNYDDRSLEFKKTLKDFTSDCEVLSNIIPLVTYNKLSLTRLIEYYNSCEPRPFPFINYGLVLGYEINKLSLNSNTEEEYLKDLNYKYIGNLHFGAFIDFPILINNFSARLEVHYTQNGFALNYKDVNKEVDLIINTTSINIPVLFRNTYPSLKYRPFINAGLVYSYHLTNESELYEATISNSQIDIKKVNTESLISKHQLGYSVGAGIQLVLDYRRLLLLEIRYNNFFGIPDANSLNKNQIQILTGISF
ncbi:MAG: PorT family protein [Bacteroidetes bacterium]|nr:PorT family protein [Bacteroidota bacterium]